MLDKISRYTVCHGLSATWASLFYLVNETTEVSWFASISYVQKLTLTPFTSKHTHTHKPHTRTPRTHTHTHTHTHTQTHLHPVGFNIICAISSTSEVREVKLDLVPAIIKTHGHGANKRLDPCGGLVVGGPESPLHILIIQHLSRIKSRGGLGWTKQGR